MAIGVAQFRPRLFGVAYRMVGDTHDAEDLVQEAFLRWHRASRADVSNPEAWLVKAVTRLAIDRLRARRAERAAYPGQWLPTPIAPDRLAASADQATELASELSMAFLVLMERLAPEERAAFLMRDICGSSYADIATVLKRSEVAARQVVSRARTRVRADRARFRGSGLDRHDVLERFLAALQAEDAAGLLALFAPDATFTSDGGGRRGSARQVIRGADRVVRLLRALEQKRRAVSAWGVATLNGELALLLRDGTRTLSATFFATDGERIVAVFRVLDPRKLEDASRVPVEGGWAS
ncbi:MAG: RNA polymerase sigma factor SigJ [Gemmatimonadota bacterium]